MIIKLRHRPGRRAHRGGVRRRGRSCPPGTCPATAPGTCGSGCTCGCTPARASPTPSACTCAGPGSRSCAAPAGSAPRCRCATGSLDPREHSVFLGRAHYRHGLRVPLEEHVLVMAPPRTFKTAFLADVILRYPGPVIATSTKPDVYALTSAVRAQLGPVHVFNPQHIGGVPSTFCWSPVDGCQDPATAIRRADAFAFAVSQKGVEDGTFWSAKASDYLRGYFHAAALAGYDLRAVAAWVSGADPHIPEQILAAAGARQWAYTLAELRGEAHKTAATVRMVMSRALAFMADPDLAASVLPAPGTGFSIPAFLRDAGTLYMIAEAVSEDAPVAPLFAAMASEIHWIAAQIGQASASGRLDPPLLMGLDEVTQICPVPLPSWLSDSGGKGIQVVAVVHGEAQLAERWGDHGRQVVLDTCSVKVFLPGITDVTTLQAASTLCGQASWKVRGQDHATRHDVATPDMIRQLPAGFALVIRGGCAPVIARLPRAWRNPAYRRARRQAPDPGRARPGQRPVHPRSRARRADPRRRHRPALEPDMTDDQITAALDQLAAQREQITRLDAREATHYATLTGLLAGLTARPGPDPAARGPRRLPARPGPVLVAAQPGGPAGAGGPAARLGGPGLPARLRPPGRRPRPLLARPRPVPVRPGHRLRPVVGPVPPARPRPRAAVRPGRIPGPRRVSLVLDQDGAQMRLTEDQHAVEELAAQGTEEAFAGRVHPGSLDSSLQDPGAVCLENGVEGPGEV